MIFEAKKGYKAQHGLRNCIFGQKRVEELGDGRAFLISD